MINADEATMRAVINLVIPKNQVSSDRPCAHRKYRGTEVEIYGDINLPTGTAMELANYLAIHGISGKANFTAFVSGEKMLSGIQVIRAIPDTRSIEMTFWNKGDGIGLYLRCNGFFQDICERLSVPMDLPDDDDLLFPDIKRINSIKDKPYEYKGWTADITKTILENIGSSCLNGAITFKSLRDVIAITFGIHPEDLGENGGRSIYQLAVRPMVKAEILTKNADGCYELRSAGKPAEKKGTPVFDILLAEQVTILIGESQAAKKKKTQLEEAYFADEEKMENMRKKLEAMAPIQKEREKQIASCQAEIDRVKAEINGFL